MSTLWEEKKIISYSLHRTHLLHFHAVIFHFYDCKLLKFFCGLEAEEVVVREPEPDGGKQMPSPINY